MAFSLRPACAAGLAVVSASTIAFTSVVTPMPGTSTADAGSTGASQLAVDLRAEIQPLLQERRPTAPLFLSTPLADASPALGTRAVTPTIVPTPPLINLANFIDAAYLAIEPWVEYAFEVAAYVVSWIPYGWLIDDQIWVLYNFGERLVRSGVFNTTDWLRGQGSALKNIADWLVDAGLALIWLGLDELSAWVPLPPLPWYPPKPPIADVPEGLFGDIVIGLSAALARVSNGIWNIWEPIKGGIDRGVGFVSDVLDALAWVPFIPLINFEISETWTLIATEGDAITGFAHDLINAGNQFIIDSVDGDGLIAATMNAIDATLNSISTRGGQAVQALVDWGRAQIDYLVDFLTPGAASTSTEASAAADDASGDVLAAGSRTVAVTNDGLALSDDSVLGSGPETDTADNTIAGVSTSGSDRVATSAAPVTAAGTSGPKLEPADSGTTRHSPEPVPDKSATGNTDREFDRLSAGSSKATQKPPKDEDDEDHDETVNSRDAGTEKPAEKPGVDADNASDKAGAEADGQSRSAGTETSNTSRRDRRH
jgi:hypothetical protein